ncbi:MAG: MMPL family transporter [Bacteroidia bacterium]|nr:MMPL family transporter [Bacteroidia bacterium]
MWKRFSGLLLRNKIVFTTVVGLITGLMVYETLQVRLSYDFAQILPDDDSTYVEYQRFKKHFGEDGNVMVVGFEDKHLFEFQKFSDWLQLSKDIKAIDGVNDLLSVPTSYKLIRNDSLQKFDFIPLITKPIKSQKDVDSIKSEFLNLPFYEGLIYNKETGANVMAITFTKKDLNSKHRLEMVAQIRQLADAFGAKHHVQMRYSGMPFIRSHIMLKVSHEMTLFLVLAVIVTAIILWFFFRSGTVVFYSLIITALGVLWSMGIMQLFGYKITILTGLIPPLIMVIGLPNCIFLINKYQSEFIAHGNKIKAIARSIETMGVTLFMANITTAIGFGVLYFTNSLMLVQFGIVASISVMATYFITLILVPVILNYLPAPKPKQVKHQDNKNINAFLQWVDRIVLHKRKAIYIVSTIITIICLWGMKFINMNGFVVDDLPKNDIIYSDLHFFEQNFNGVLPFEIAIDTHKENGLFANNAKALYKIKALQKIMESYPMFSKPISIVEAVKFSYQAYKDGNPKYYRVPSVSDLKTLSEYTGSLKGQGNKLSKFIDSTRQMTRVSYQAADIGSKKMKEVMAKLRPQIDSIFPPDEYKVSTTGHSLVFLKNNDYLLYNLLESLVIEIILIAIVAMFLFRSVLIIVLSKLPCLIPLAITAGVMGFFNIQFKPSTILIFSIAFGISSDGTVYFLAKYRQELKKLNDPFLAISATIKETGRSMVYTAIILFFGFSIFAASNFGGTVALGVLMSLTLLMSMFSNLVLLPAILLSIHRKKLKDEIIEEPLIDINDEEESA